MRQDNACLTLYSALNPNSVKTFLREAINIDLHACIEQCNNRGLKFFWKSGTPLSNGGGEPLEEKSCALELIRLFEGRDLWRAIWFYKRHGRN